MDPSLYQSPKRKRDANDSSPVTLQTSGFTHEFARRASDTESTGGDQSPRTSVARKLQRLDLRNAATAANHRIQFRETKFSNTTEHLDHSLLWHSDGANMEIHQQPHHPEGMFTFKAGHSPTPMSISPPGSTDTSPSSSQQQPNKSETTSTQSASTSVRSRPGKSPPPANTKVNQNVKSPPLQPIGLQPSRSTSTDSESDFWWSSSEITGWDPADPDEDNYGVNGVGYQRTAAAAYSLSQKRKQQIAEYRSREAREARQRRSENRRSSFRLSGSRKGSPTATAAAAALTAGGSSGRPGSSSMMNPDENHLANSEAGLGAGNVTGGSNVRCVRFEVG